ncbi:hypothetical protein [Mycobacterium sp. TY815]|uniref:hypothetical protein n=1 Tax=Mycobacterium sp. TY815 TaxID=3050581 RepID=UPI0027412972|nr:hypothetical protein [Mycobacterium sp. TY815]MDP7703245.1 hypothetical protein [Mycobacterium sp. TY815]
MTRPRADSADEPEHDIVEKAIDVRWPDDMGANVEAVNQVIFAWDQASSDAVYMYLGHIGPPPWLSPDAAEERLAAAGGSLLVAPKGSFILGRDRAEEMWLALGRHLGKLPR